METKTTLTSGSKSKKKADVCLKISNQESNATVLLWQWQYFNMFFSFPHAKKVIAHA